LTHDTCDEPGAATLVGEPLGAATRGEAHRAPRPTACLHELFEAQAARTPEAASVVFEDQQVDYGELNRRADQLARTLRRLGVGPEVLVGICLERSIELVVGLLAILKAGGAYVPLDPAYPRERLEFMREDSGLGVVLTQQRLLDLLPTVPVRLCLDATPLNGAGPAEGPRARPDNLAYVIYTSGSTGRPKGAMNTHGSIVNRLLWMQEAYRLDTADRVLQKTPARWNRGAVNMLTVAGWPPTSCWGRRPVLSNRLCCVAMTPA